MQYISLCKWNLSRNKERCEIIYRKCKIISIGHKNDTKADISLILVFCGNRSEEWKKFSSIANCAIETKFLSDVQKKKNDRKQWSDDLDYLFRLLCLQKWTGYI